MCQSLPRAPRSSLPSQSRRPRPSGARVSTSSRPGAFTLVELLVVIGIIVVLVAILMPVLARAWEQARTVQCASNIGQIYKSLMIYAAENRGILPVPAGPRKYELTPVGLARCAVWVEEWGWLDYHEGALWPYVAAGVEARQRLFLCPSDEEPRFARHVHILPIADPNRPRNFSYNFNAYMSGYRSPSGHVSSLQMAKIRRPSHKILIYEQEMPVGMTAGPIAEYAPNPGERAGPPIIVLLTRRHSGKANAGFADGHVESIDPKIFSGPGPKLHSVDAWHVYHHVFSDR